MAGLTDPGVHSGHKVYLTGNVENGTSKGVRLYIMAPNNTVLKWTTITLDTVMRRHTYSLSSTVAAALTNYADLRLQFTKWHTNGDPTTVVIKKVEFKAPAAGSNAAPSACFSSSSTSATVGQNITFDGNCSSDPNGQALSSTWDFGGGTGASGLSTSHTYASAGNYNVTLTVSDSTYAQTKIVTIVVTDPLANQIAPDLYRYDKINRLTQAFVRDPTGGTTQQDYTYDVFGNMTKVSTWAPGQSAQHTTIAVNPDTNRLSSAAYDASGNMTTWGSDGYEYDTANNMVSQDGRWYFIYNFAGERVATIDWQGSIATREVDYTIRGPSNQVLSTFKLVGEDQSGNWTHEIDYIWMGRRLLGTQDGSGTKQHYHTDHLGSVRLVTDDLGNKISEHEYLPYGEEITAAGNGIMKFTGHERDADTGMDYMHARFYTSHLGRMMSVDPVQRGDGEI